MPTAIITGASRGLGYALAEQLVAAGWRLILDARGADALHAAAVDLGTVNLGAAGLGAAGLGAAGLGAAGLGVAADLGTAGSVEAIAGDITSAAHRADLIRAAKATGGLDLLINNAGILGPSPLPSTAELSAVALREIIEVNVVAPLALTQLALPLLRESRGVVIDVTSDAAVEGYPGWGGYGAAKAATEQLRSVLAAEEAELPIGVTVWRVDPGDLRTAMHQLAFPGEDISDRPLPQTVAPGLLGLLAARPASGRYRLADFVSAPQDPTAQDPTAQDPTAQDPTAQDPTAQETAAKEQPGLETAAQDIAARDRAAGAEWSLDPVALWLTMEVDEFEPAVAFYRDSLGLPEIDGWSIDGEDGAVFAIGPAARIEVERPAPPTAPTVTAATVTAATVTAATVTAATVTAGAARAAIEYPGLDALAAVHERIGSSAGSAAAPVIVHHRGHSGFTVHDPRGNEIYLWSEK